jgi:hypothetical protein
MGQRNQLKGPAAKNHKVWNNSNTSGFFTATAYQTLEGPRVKNSKPWKNEVDYSPVKQIARVQLLGPKAKNSHRFVYQEHNNDQIGSTKDILVDNQPIKYILN